MKKLLYLLILALSVSYNSHAQIRSGKDILGKWKTEKFQLEFFADGRAGLILPGGSIPGATYKTDFLQNPNVIYISVIQDRQKQVYTFYTRFIDNNTIEVKGDNKDAAGKFLKGRSLKLSKVNK